ncbi:MAG: beta-lactamase family protein [Candidatus Zixiibacteriota bacterium]|nr:MAG: beta-lactamase family protein [candidate division Zixibacteria bacterium]
MRHISTVFVYILLGALAIPASAQQLAPEIPDTPSGKLLTRLINAFNSGEEEQWKDFIRDHWKEKEGSTFERRLEFFTMVYADVGGLILNRIEESDDYFISALLQAKQPSGPFEWVMMSLQADTLPPHKLDMLSVRPGEEPGFEAPEGDLTQEQMLDFLDRYLDNLVSKDQFSGTVLIAKDGKPFYTRAEGLASKRFNVPNQLNTKFNLGSMNKMFTGVAIMQLVEQRKVSLNDPVGKYLPDLPHPEIAEKVTLHHLLTHTSGMQDYWDEVYDAHWWEIKTVDQLAELIFDDSLLFEPGSDFHYSNSGPIVLGMIIEAVTGQDYYDYVREKIHQPAGMTNTDCYEMDTPVPNLAIGYTKMTSDGTPTPDGSWRNNLFTHVVKGGPAGGGFSTVVDLLRFDIALRGNKLIGKESFDTLTTGKTERGRGTWYAYLFQDKTVNGHRIVGHGGGAPGINANLDMYLGSGYTVAVMANYDGAASKVARKIEELLAR